MFKTKSGYTGDNLLALVGRCTKCDTEAKIYYANCRDDIRSKILSFLRTGKTKYKGLCLHCFVIARLKESVIWHKVQDRVITDQELSIMNMGGGLDIKEIEREIKRQEKESRIGEEFLQENKERIDYYTS